MKSFAIIWSVCLLILLIWLNLAGADIITIEQKDDLSVIYDTETKTYYLKHPNGSIPMGWYDPERPVIDPEIPNPFTLPPDNLIIYEYERELWNEN